MNRNTVATIRLDVRLQARSQLYSIGIGVALLFGLVSRFLVEPHVAGRVLAAFYLLGIGTTTYIFGAALVLLEKSQGTLEALRVTPLSSTAYITSKVVTLTTFALVESALVYFIAFPGTATNLIPLLLGVTVLGVLYTLIGLGQIAPYDSVTSFLMPGALLVGSVVQLPVMHVLEIGPAFAWYLVPTQAPVLLMLGAFEPLEVWQWIYGVGVSACAIGVGAWWAKRRFARFIALQE